MQFAVAQPKQINVDRVFFRHRFSEENLIQMLLAVVQTGRWNFPPPLVVEFEFKDLPHFWALDGHHRIHVAQLLSSNGLKSQTHWSYVVAESDYVELINSEFGGVEPARIGPVRDKIVTPYGTASLIDENWKSIQDSVSPDTFVTKPWFFYETSDGVATAVNYAGLRLSKVGKLEIWERNRSPTEIFSFEDPLLERRDHSFSFVHKVSTSEDREIEVEMELKWDSQRNQVSIENRTPGIKSSLVWSGAKTESHRLDGNVGFTDESLENTKRMIAMAIVFKERLRLGDNESANLSYFDRTKANFQRVARVFDHAPLPNFAKPGFGGIRHEEEDADSIQ